MTLAWAPAACWLISASISSAGDTVAVPAFPTTTPEARMANSTAVSSVAPAPSASPSAARPVSPAPDTSNTSRARPGKCLAASPRRIRLMPLPARVTTTALASVDDSKAPRAASTSSSVPTGSPVAPASSLAFGLIRSTAP